MSRQSKADMIRRSGGAENGRDHDSDSTVNSHSGLGIGRLVASKTVLAVSGSLREAVGDRADMVQLLPSPRLVIAGAEELGQLKGWKDDRDSSRTRSIGDFIGKLSGNGVNRSTASSRLDLAVVRPAGLFSVDESGQLVATLTGLAQDDPLQREITAVRNGLHLDGPPPGQAETEIQLIFGAPANKDYADQVKRFDVRRMGIVLDPSVVSFMPLGPVASENSTGQ